MTWAKAPWVVVLMAALLILGGSSVAAATQPGMQAPPLEDPVLQARAQRASAMGISEEDLPPVPRSIVEPPPLPPPELHPRDQKGRRAARKGRRTTRVKAKASKKGRSQRRTRTKRTR